MDMFPFDFAFPWYSYVIIPVRKSFLSVFKHYELSGNTSPSLLILVRRSQQVDHHAEANPNLCNAFSYTIEAATRMQVPFPCNARGIMSYPPGAFICGY